MTSILCSRAVASGLVVLAVMSTTPVAGQTPDTSGTRWNGLRAGPHAVGFEVRKGVDATRRVNQSDAGMRIGLAIWYPARTSSCATTAMTMLGYRLLEFATPLDERQRQAYEDDEATALRAWRHIGIVELTGDQARASLHTRGMAVQGAPAAPGRFPVVVVLGGPHYLSTTAELLASHGFLVVAAIRYADQSIEVGAGGIAEYLESSVRNAEWALNEIRSHPGADLRHVSAIGHGGGGMLAMLFAMRDRSVGALVNLDAGNFSNRSRTKEIPFYSRRSMRVPYLYVATAETRKSQDLFDEFTGMTFSERFEVVLNQSEVRHHDLSDYGRAVTAPMAIRGAAQADVQQRYVDVHEMAVRFLLERSGRPLPAGGSFAEWLKTLDSGHYTVTARAGSEPAPTTVRVLETLNDATAATLSEARRRDPEAPLFQPLELARVISKAVVVKNLQAALAVADFAIEVHPGEPVLHELKSQVLEQRGDLAGAAKAATACAALPPDNDWRASVAIIKCQDRLERLGRTSKAGSAF